MKTKNSVWIDPKDCGLVTLEEVEQRRIAAAKARRRAAEKRERERRLQAQHEAERQLQIKQEERERKLREEGAGKKVEGENRMAKFNSTPLEGEIVRVDTTVAKSIEMRNVASIAEHLQNLTNQMLETLDLSKRDFLDRFRTIDGRIEVRIRRSGQLGALIATFGDNIDQLRIVAEKMGALKRVAVQQQLQRMQDEFELIQAQIRIDSAHDEARERARIEREKADAEVERIRAEKADHQARIREAGLRGYPAPPPPPPAPVAPPEDPRAKAKANYERELERLTKEETEKISKLTGGKPEAEWSDDTRAEVIRTKNMYSNAREKLRDKLRGVL